MRCRTQAAGPEIEMTPTASIPPLGFEFDSFLFALVGEDRNGMPLSVVSVLARMELDPWVEAASLAALPAETAARKLAAWLDALPDPSLKTGEPRHQGCSFDRIVAAAENSELPGAFGGKRCRCGSQTPGAHQGDSRRNLSDSVVVYPTLHCTPGIAGEPRTHAYPGLRSRPAAGATNNFQQVTSSYISSRAPATSAASPFCRR